MRYFKNIILYRTFLVAASYSFRFPASSFIKKGTPAKRFFCEFWQIFKTSFCRTPPDDCFLGLPVILGSFSDHLFYRAPLGKCLFYVQVAEFQPPETIKVFHKCFQTYFNLYKKTICNYSEASIYLKSLKIICQ